SLSTLWQHFGCAVRNMSSEGTAILFAEKEHFDEYKMMKEKRKQREMPSSQNKQKAVAITNNVPPVSTRIPTGDEQSNCSDASDEEIGVSNILNQQCHENNTMNGKQLWEKMQVPREKANINQPRHKTSQPTGLEPGMDYLINADVCPGIGCQRKVLDAVFENETAESDHHKCNTSLKTGCLWYLITPPKICCDIHTPEHFTSFMSIIPKHTKQPSCPHITKFSMASIDFKLVDVLEDWREDTTQKLYGQAHLHDLGPSLVMPNDILNRIVDCAHFHKIKSPTDLLKETHWSGVDEHGDDIVALILQVSPLPSPSTPFISTPL
ncbi:hypothetical protein BDR06DRAFT_854745, partial [Suillus hirtellus]